MSKVVRCDICGKLTKFEATIRVWEKSQGLWGLSYDLCRECFKELERHLNRNKKGSK